VAVGGGGGGVATRIILLAGESSKTFTCLLTCQAMKSDLPPGGQPISNGTQFAPALSANPAKFSAMRHPILMARVEALSLGSFFAGARLPRAWQLPHILAVRGAQ
jgi:hypothetical protein